MNLLVNGVPCATIDRSTGARVLVLPARSFNVTDAAQEREYKEAYKRWLDGDDNPFGFPVA